VAGGEGIHRSASRDAQGADSSRRSRELEQAERKRRPRQGRRTRYGGIPGLERTARRPSRRATLPAAATSCCCARRSRATTSPRWSPRWTGIPVEQAGGGRDGQAAPHGGRAARARRSVRTRRSSAVADAVRRARAGPAATPTARSAQLPVPRPHRRGQDRARQGPGRSSCSTSEEAMVRIDMSRVHGEARRSAG
jgi:hypothetical protein